jgi:hypothetical protein
MVTSLPVGVKIPLEQIGKEEETKDGKHDKQLDQDDSPQFSAPGHAPESFSIETDYFFYHGRKVPKSKTENRINRSANIFIFIFSK